MRFRFRTSVLIGRWHSHRASARADAIRLGQAAFDPASGFEWKVPGEIESEATLSDLDVESSDACLDPEKRDANRRF